MEDFYAARALPARYHLSPAVRPGDLDAVLAERGYVVEGATHVQTASLADLLARTQPGRPDFEVRVAERLEEDWLRAYCAAEAVPGREVEGRCGILRRGRQPSGFALVRAGGEPVAVGLGVLADGWLGLFSLVTLPPFRRRGAATALLHGLARWAGEHRADGGVYLQVMRNNAAALRLYERLGFTTLYDYHYRTSPPAPGERGAGERGV